MSKAEQPAWSTEPDGEAPEKAPAEKAPAEKAPAEKAPAPEAAAEPTKTAIKASKVAKAAAEATAAAEAAVAEAAEQAEADEADEAAENAAKTIDPNKEAAERNAIIRASARAQRDRLITEKADRMAKIKRKLGKSDFAFVEAFYGARKPKPMSDAAKAFHAKRVK